MKNGFEALGENTRAGGGWGTEDRARGLASTPARGTGTRVPRGAGQSSGWGAGGRAGRTRAGRVGSQGLGGGPYRQPQGLQHLPLVFVPRSDVPPGEVVVSGEEALEKARGPSPAAVPTATPVVTALLHATPPHAPRQAAAAGDPASQTQPPGPGARLHGRSHRLQPRTAGV